jgi:hypothetical protein
MYKLIKKICEGCGIEFMARGPKIRFCTNVCAKTGAASHRWKGDSVGIDALHTWIRRRFPKPEFCQECKKSPTYDLANISNEYKRDISDWEWLCRKCHMGKDGRNATLKKHNDIRKIKPRNCPVCNKSFTPDRSITKHCSLSCATITRHREGKIKSRKGIKNKK